jgi:hypothetical protein
MTDHSPVPDDELVSAYLDDAVDADSRARVESTPELLARADRLAGIRNAVATNRPVPDARQRDEHIANALAEFATAPTELAERRERRTRRLAVLSAAAAVLVVAGVLALIAGRDDRDGLSSSAGKAVATTVASAAGVQSDRAAPTTPAAEATTAARGATTTTAAARGGTTTAAAAAGATTPAPVAGATTTASALSATTTTAPQPFAEAPVATDLGNLDAESAPAVLRTVRDRRLAPPTACAVPAGTHYVGTATYEGSAVFAFVSDSAGSASAVVIDEQTCVVIADLPLT